MCLCLLAVLAVLPGCQLLDATVPLPADQAEAREREAQLAAMEETASDPERWSRLTREGREHLLLGNLSDAEETLLEAFSVSKQFRASDVRRRASFGNLERLARRYRSDQADAAARRVLAIISIETAGMSEFEYPKLSDLLVELGGLEERRGDLDAAVQAYRRALELRTDKSGALSPSLIEVYTRLSSVEVQRGQAERAIEFAERAVELAKNQVGDESAEHVRALLHAASANQEAGHLDRAERQLDQALSRQRRRESSSYLEAALLNALASVQLDASRLAQATASIESALAIFDLLSIRGLDRALLLDTQAQILAAKGQTNSANALFDEVMLHADAATPATQRQLYESYEAFLVDQNRLGEAKRLRDQIDALAIPVPSAPDITTEDGETEAPSAAPVAEVSAGDDGAAAWAP